MVITWKISSDRMRDMVDCTALYGNAHSYGFGDIKYAMIPVRLLRLDGTYQREADERHVNELVANWSDNECNHIVVNFRDDRLYPYYYVIDGQHRFEAAMRLGMLALPCKIYHKLTRAQEAMMFAEQGARTKRVNSFAKFRALVAAGDDAALKIEELCKKFGVSTVSKPAGTPGALGGMTQVMRIYKYGGVDAVARIFETVERCGWHAYPGAYGSYVLNALLRVYCEKGFSSKTMNQIVDKIGDMAPVTVMCKAREANVDLGPTRALTKYLSE